jgi:hypothetical protein
VLKMALSGEKKTFFFLCCCPLFLNEKLKHNMSAFTKMYSFSYRQVNELTISRIVTVRTRGLLTAVITYFRSKLERLSLASLSSLV